jgi:hypothetical protein
MNYSIPGLFKWNNVNRVFGVVFYSIVESKNSQAIRVEQQSPEPFVP